MEPDSSTAPLVAIVGGGISGLAAAQALAGANSGPPVRVAILEAADRLGGKVLTRELGGRPIEAGPDAFLTRSSEAVELCREVGLGDQLIAPSGAPASIWMNGRLCPIPAGLTLGVPVRFVPLMRSGILSPLGLLRAALEPMLTRQRLSEEPTVAELIIPRFGREVFERLVDPLLGGIYAGRSDLLSAAAVMPRLLELARGSGSLVRALRGATAPSATFNSLRAGLGSLIDALAGSLGRSGVDVQLSSPVRTLRRDGDGRIVLERPKAPSVTADAVIIAAPASDAASILAAGAPNLAKELNRIEYASVAMVGLAYSPAAIPSPSTSSGFLVPRGKGRVVVGVTAVSAKWPQPSSTEQILYRVAVGRADDEHWRSQGDEQLVRLVHTELAGYLGLTQAPESFQVTRWPGAIPQYKLGHQARLSRIGSMLEFLPGVFLCGAGYEGLGIPACIRQGREAAEKVLEGLPRSDSDPGWGRRAAP
ncbi:MAG TPA: protoporphyrinogen oxidase [Candidatus Acidoferrales bacterium]|nr:protoporphyrinogen oxidase [Candidatus Acidoferrales bacterium]